MPEPEPIRSPPGLLVSVRSAEEARAAVAGGASIIDVKEPDRGPLGMADPVVWRSVRAAVPASVPVSVALGELIEWGDREPPERSAFAGIAFRKLGLAGAAGTDWPATWRTLRDRLGEGPAWVAVVYLDWSLAQAPPPEGVIREAREAGCAGVLFDSWDKARPAPAIDPRWVRQAREAGGLVALAGGLDAGSIQRYVTLRLDVLAVRGAACAGGDRRGMVQAGRVAELVRGLAAG